MSRILTDKQRSLITKARKRVSRYRNSRGEFTVTCKDCGVMYIHGLLEVIDDLEFELEQLDK